MNRTVVMTLGFLLVFFGIQLNLVDSYVLTPRMANFLSDQFPETSADQINSVDIVQPPGAFTQAGYSTNQANQANQQYNFRVPSFAPAAVNRVIRPPGWIGWPIMFLGAVFFLNGVAIRK